MDDASSGRCQKMLISTVSTVRASYNDLQMFVNYHLNCGVDRMFLFFDDPGDECFERLRSDKRLTCIRCDASHWTAAQLSGNTAIEVRQLHNASLALEWARQEGIDWIIHLDSDELVFVPEQDLKLHLQAVDEHDDAITFPTLEALPQLCYERHFFEEIHWFKRVRSYVPHAIDIARLMGCHRVLKYGYFRGHTAGKTATRVQSSVAMLGTHLPIACDGKELRITTSSNAFTLHYDCCTFTHWKLKWKRRHDGTSMASRMRESRRRQFSDFVAAYQSGSESRMFLEYRQQCIVSTYQKMILLGLGLLGRVRLRDGVFLSSEPSKSN
jgi:Glycosyl transferase family 2